jgi:uncharacterized protein YbjT (DUF2867 family)
MEHDESETRHFGKAYNITGPDALSYYQAAEILSNTAGKKIYYVPIRKPLEIDVTLKPPFHSDFTENVAFVISG